MGNIARVTRLFSNVYEGLGAWLKNSSLVPAVCEESGTETTHFQCLITCSMHIRRWDGNGLGRRLTEQ